MNLLERKTEFDEKVKKYLSNPTAQTEVHYANYLTSVYKNEFKEVNYSDARNYVIIEFNRQSNDKTQ